MEKTAIVRTGGKQYVATIGKKIKIEKLSNEAGLSTPVGEEIALNDVLLIIEGDKVSVGTPVVAGASIKAKVLAQDKAEKVMIFKFKAKKREKKKRGHRQSYTEIEIVDIQN